jgi:hypothetical protein
VCVGEGYSGTRIRCVVCRAVLMVWRGALPGAEASITMLSGIQENVIELSPATVAEADPP